MERGLREGGGKGRESDRGWGRMEWKEKEEDGEERKRKRGKRRSKIPTKTSTDLVDRCCSRVLVLVLIKKQYSVGALCCFLNSLLFEGRNISFSSVL